MALYAGMLRTAYTVHCKDQGNVETILKLFDLNPEYVLKPLPVWGSGRLT